MNDHVQAEPGGSRGCFFAALGAGCLLLILIIGGAAGLFFYASPDGPAFVPLPAPKSPIGEFPTHIVSSGEAAQAAFHIYVVDEVRRADFGNIRLEWQGRKGVSGSFSGAITLSEPVGLSTGITSSSAGADFKITTDDDVTTGEIYGARFVVKQGMMSLDGQSFDTINGPPTVIVLDDAGKITETRLH